MVLVLQWPWALRSVFTQPFELLELLKLFFFKHLNPIHEQLLPFQYDHVEIGWAFLPFEACQSNASGWKCYCSNNHVYSKLQRLNGYCRWTSIGRVIASLSLYLTCWSSLYVLENMHISSTQPTFGTFWLGVYSKPMRFLKLGFQILLQTYCIVMLSYQPKVGDAICSKFIPRICT